MSDRKSIDDFFKDGTQQDYPFDPSLWNQMPVVKPRRSAGIWWIFGSVLLISVIVGGIYLIPGQQEGFGTNPTGSHYSPREKTSQESLAGMESESFKNEMNTGLLREFQTNRTGLKRNTQPIRSHTFRNGGQITTEQPMTKSQSRESILDAETIRTATPSVRTEPPSENVNIPRNILELSRLDRKGVNLPIAGRAELKTQLDQWPPHPLQLNQWSFRLQSFWLMGSIGQQRIYPNRQVADSTLLDEPTVTNGVLNRARIHRWDVGGDLNLTRRNWSISTGLYFTQKQINEITDLEVSRPVWEKGPVWYRLLQEEGQVDGRMVTLIQEMRDSTLVGSETIPGYQAEYRTRSQFITVPLSVGVTRSIYGMQYRMEVGAETRFLIAHRETWQGNPGLDLPQLNQVVPRSVLVRPLAHLSLSLPLAPRYSMEVGLRSVWDIRENRNGGTVEPLYLGGGIAFRYQL
jgi:hypothetical protein